MWRAFEKKLEQALQLDLPHSVRLQIPAGKQAAVLLLFAPDEQDHPHVLITKRTELLASHKGQMAFPGGVCDPEELEDPWRTAVRENEEEVGIARRLVRRVGELPCVTTPTGYEMRPYVGLCDQRVDTISLVLSADEIAETVWVPLRVLEDPATYRRELFRVGAVDYPIHVYQVGHHRIWGATGAILRNLMERLVG